MGKATVRKIIKRDASPVYVNPFSSGIKSFIYSRSEPRWRVLPPEIVHIIMKMLGTDRKSLGACALAAREFTFAASCCLGRHIAVNTVPRLRECANLVAKPLAFQHVRSLDLGVTTKRVIRERDWVHYLTILDFFAHRRTLTRLWLSEVSFHSHKRWKQESIRNIITSLAATVDELGLYSCRFSSYADMISLIRAFPLCKSLYVRDCVTKKNPGEDIFAKLPQHKLYINDLELTSSSDHRHLIDASTLINDAALDISSLTGFSCDMTTADVARHTVMTAANSQIERFQLVCDEPEGFHGTFNSSENPTFYSSFYPSSCRPGSDRVATQVADHRSPRSEEQFVV